ncbi:MAG: helix-turn-helix domain-containing protein [Acidimicrobiia bacterium]|nr:helix-turn-helix domain-containing protein [Acidimicrobiia bacterium]
MSDRWSLKQGWRVEVARILALGIQAHVARGVRVSKELLDLATACNELGSGVGSDQVPISAEVVEDRSGWLSTDEAAGRLEVSEERVRFLARRGRLRAERKDGWPWVFDPESVEEYRQNRRRPRVDGDVIVHEEADPEGRWRVRVEVQVDSDLWPEPDSTDTEPEMVKFQHTIAKRSHVGQVGRIVRRVGRCATEKWLDHQLERTSERVGV